MKALIDADIICYEFGGATDEEGFPLSWQFVATRVSGRIRMILDAIKADTSALYLTSDDKSNFRIKAATIKPYKGHRTDEKPFWHSQVKRFLIDFHRAELVYGMEADDKLGIEQDSDRTVICSRDKDLKMIPGWHYNWGAGAQKEEPLWWQDELGAIRCFYKQLLTGDATDNIPGLFGVGESSALVKKVDTLLTELEMYQHVSGEYEKRFGSYWRTFLWENAHLLWILRSPNVNEIHERLKELEAQSIAQSLNDPLENL